MVFLVLAFISNIATAGPTFFDVAEGRALGFDAEAPAVRTRATEEAKVYEAYRQRNDRIFVDRCAVAPEANRFCVLLKPEDAASNRRESPSPETRRLLFDALTKLDDPATRASACPSVAPGLRTVLGDGDAVILRSRARYWLWTCARLTHDDVEAARWREELWAHHPLSDLTVTAMRADRDARLDDVLADANPDWPLETRDPGDENLNQLLRGIEALIKLGHDGAAAVVLKRIYARISEKSALGPYVAALSARIARTIPSARPVNLALEPLLTDAREYMTRRTLGFIYARPKYFDELDGVRGDVDAGLLAGLIHQESALYPRARSDVAFGLAQMKPNVATELNHDAGVFPDRGTIDAAALFEPRVSLALAAIFLKQLILKFGGDESLALAAYHSGPKRLETWLAGTYAFKDPVARAHALYLDAKGPTSTAAYILNVQGRATWYRLLYGEDLARR